MPEQIQQIVVNNHKGIVNQAQAMFQERQPPEFARYASDVIFDLQNNVHVAWGYQPLIESVFTNVNNVSCIYYSTTLQHILVLEGSTLKSINARTGAVLFTSGSVFLPGSKLSFAEWPQTGEVYITDGDSYRSIDVTGNVVNRTASAPTGFGEIICTHKSRIWFKLNDNEVVPCETNNPLSFNTNNAIRAVEDGDKINAIWSNENLLFLGKDATIFAIGGRDADTFVIKNLGTGRGPVGIYAVWSFNGIVYFVGKDGLYRFNTEAVESIHKLISNLIVNMTNLDGSEFDDACIVVPLVPTWEPDYGRQYILFVLKYQNGFYDQIFRYDVETQDFVELFVNTIVLSFTAFTYSKDLIKTYFMEVKNNGSRQLFAFEHTDEYIGEDIIGQYETQQIDAGVRHLLKDYKRLNLFPVQPGAAVSADFDGTNIYPWIITDEDQTEFQHDNTGKGYVNNLLFRRTGGLKPIVGGLCQEVSILPINLDRSFASSRRDNINNGMNLGSKPYIVGSTTLAGGETSILVTHGLGYIPKSIIVSFQGYTSNKVLVVDLVGITQFRVTLQTAALAGQKIYWIALKRGPINLFDSGITGGKLLVRATDFVFMPHQLNFNIGSGATTLITQIASTAGSTTGITEADPPLAANSINLRFGYGVNSPPYEFYWLAIKSGTDPWFKAERITASPWVHGLGAVPSAVFLHPNQLSVPTHGITSISSTQVVYSGSGDYNAAVFL